MAFHPSGSVLSFGSCVQTQYLKSVCSSTPLYPFHSHSETLTCLPSFWRDTGIVFLPYFRQQFVFNCIQFIILYLQGQPFHSSPILTKFSILWLTDGLMDTIPGRRGCRLSILLSEFCLPSDPVCHSLTPGLTIPLLCQLGPALHLLTPGWSVGHCPHCKPSQDHRNMHARAFTFKLL